MVYINSGDDKFSVQDVLESSPRIRIVYKMITVKGQSIPKQSKGPDHHLWEPYTKLVLLTFNHHNEWYFAFSNSCIIGVSMFLNNLLLRSF